MGGGCSGGEGVTDVRGMCCQTGRNHSTCRLTLACCLSASIELPQGHVIWVAGGVTSAIAMYTIPLGRLWV